MGNPYLLIVAFLHGLSHCKIVAPFLRTPIARWLLLQELLPISYDNDLILSMICFFSYKEGRLFYFCTRRTIAMLCYSLNTAGHQ